MKLIVTAVAILLFLAGIILLRGVKTENFSPSSAPALLSPTPTPQTQEVNLEASFQIITQGAVRSFKNSKYHLKSPQVYLLADDPTVVHVKRIGITWDDFFKSLPMKLTKDCLITGDRETFCNNSAGTLRFYLNDKEDSNLLDREIKDGDKALIKY